MIIMMVGGPENPGGPARDHSDTDVHNVVHQYSSMKPSSSSCFNESDTSNDDDESYMTPEALDPSSIELFDSASEIESVALFDVLGHRPTVFMEEDGQAEVTIGARPTEVTTTATKSRAPPTVASDKDFTEYDYSDVSSSFLCFTVDEDTLIPTTTPTTKPRKPKVPLELPPNSLLDAATKPQTSYPPVGAPAPNQATSMTLMCCQQSSFPCLADPHHADSLTLYHPQQDAERMISTLLGDPIGMEAWCHGWQAWSYFSSDNGPISNNHGSFHKKSKSRHAKANKEDLKRVLRNRAFDMSARRQRLYILRKNVCPFEDGSFQQPAAIVKEVTSATASQKNQDILLHKPQRLTKTKSLPLAGIRPTNAANQRGHRAGLPPPPTISVWESMQSCTQPISLELSSDGMLADSSHQKGRNDEETDVCYDSDPEDFVQHTKSVHHTRTARANQENASLRGSIPRVSWINLRDDAAMGETVQVN